MSQPRPGKTEERKQREWKRSVPVHIVFWTFVVFLLYLFFKAFAQ